VLEAAPVEISRGAVLEAVYAVTGICWESATHAAAVAAAEAGARHHRVWLLRLPACHPIAQWSLRASQSELEPMLPARPTDLERPLALSPSP